ncbi:hypothetical protein [Candidatus Amarobacter glycogenicus]|uniref:hypothetical protein n=1 Tax=Candidatus Amarobacter glycogenicus TaxID=3140699 RepID=UPI0031366470|nr:hypothetical protein [Dehalococcoidia bacterium]
MGAGRNGTPEAQALQQMATQLDQAERPVILTGAVNDLPALVATVDAATRFDVIVGRSALTAA